MTDTDQAARADDDCTVLLARLRRRKVVSLTNDADAPDNDCVDVADEITRLRAERDALQLDFDTLNRNHAVVERELAAAVQRAEAAGWRPIEEAPKDGTKLLLWWRNCKTPAVGCWEYDESRKSIKEGWRCEGDDCIPINQSDCTHFRPLPSPPAIHDKTEG